MRTQNNENTYTNSKVNLDGNDWFGCTFRNCEIIINEGDFSFVNNSVVNCRLTLGPNATQIVQMYQEFNPVK